MNSGRQADHVTTAERYPRVLIVGYNFDLVTGGGITLSNLFDGWPRERLAVADFHPCETNPALCARQYILGADEERWVWPVRALRRGNRRPSIPDRDLTMPRVSKTAAAPPVTRVPTASSVARAAAFSTVRWLGGVGVLCSLATSSGLLRWSADVRPDLIYTWLNSLAMIRLVTQLADALSLPIALHIMDDWPSIAFESGLLAPRFRAETDRSFRAIVARASGTLAISQRMAQVYEARYGQRWEVFHNPVDIPRWARARRASWSRSGTFKIVYAGRVGLGIGPSLVDVCRAVQTLRQRGLDLALEIFTPSEPAARAYALASFDGVAVHSAIPDDDIPAVLARADLLVLPYDFAGKAAAFACLSYPTKAPAYMATGVPTLVYAPEEHALALDARDRGWAWVVDKPGAEGLLVAIERLAGDEDLRRSLAQRAFATCEREHDARVVRERFRDALERAAHAAPRSGTATDTAVTSSVDGAD